MYDIFLLTLLQFVPTNFANYDFLFHVYTLICFINRINFNVFNVYSYEIDVVWLRHGQYRVRCVVLCVMDAWRCRVWPRKLDRSVCQLLASLSCPLVHWPSTGLHRQCPMDDEIDWLIDWLMSSDWDTVSIEYVVLCVMDTCRCRVWPRKLDRSVCQLLASLSCRLVHWPSTGLHHQCPMDDYSTTVWCNLNLVRCQSLLTCRLQTTLHPTPSLSQVAYIGGD